jgi:hypothetical protein
MIKISHRGNLFGPSPEKENSPHYIIEALQNYHVEIDVWFNKSFFLGHDQPTYPISLEFLKNEKLWCHAKNIAALTEMLRNNIHCFWHQTDDVALTSQNYLWTFPGKPIATHKAIAVMPETVKNWDYSAAIGICSDYIGDYK